MTNYINKKYLVFKNTIVHRIFIIKDPSLDSFGSNTFEYRNSGVLFFNDDLHLIDIFKSDILLELYISNFTDGMYLSEIYTIRDLIRGADE